MTIQSVDRLLASILENNPEVSNVNFSVGQPPQAEIDGDLHPVRLDPPAEELTAEDTESLAMALTGYSQKLMEILKRVGSCDCPYELPDGRRFRANVFSVRGQKAVVLRALTNDVPSFSSLGLPETVQQLPQLRDGLVLVTGASGSGKSTTVSAVLEAINRDRPAHILTLEDPIEFVHYHAKSTINQRELGTDFFEFAEGLRAALRQAPSVIFVGEMRDRETMEIAMKAAETGQLVLSTMHTVDASLTLSRILGMFETPERPLVRARLAEVLRFVVSQRLLPRKDGGRAAALEVMKNDLRIKELIQHGETKERTFINVIAESGYQGMQTFDQHIAKLYDEDAITAEVAKTYASDPAIVGRHIDSLRTLRGEDTSDLGELTMSKPRGQGKQVFGVKGAKDKLTQGWNNPDDKKSRR